MAIVFANNRYEYRASAGADPALAFNGVLNQLELVQSSSTLPRVDLDLATGKYILVAAGSYNFSLTPNIASSRHAAITAALDSTGQGASVFSLLQTARFWLDGASSVYFSGAGIGADWVSCIGDTNATSLYSGNYVSNDGGALPDDDSCAYYLPISNCNFVMASFNYLGATGYSSLISCRNGASSKVLNTPGGLFHETISDGAGIFGDDATAFWHNSADPLPSVPTWLLGIPLDFNSKNISAAQFQNLASVRHFCIGADAGTSGRFSDSRIYGLIGFSVTPSQIQPLMQFFNTLYSLGLTI